MLRWNRSLALCRSFDPTAPPPSHITISLFTRKDLSTLTSHLCFCVFCLNFCSILGFIKRISFQHEQEILPICFACYPARKADLTPWLVDFGKTTTESLNCQIKFSDGRQFLRQFSSGSLDLLTFCSLLSLSSSLVLSFIFSFISCLLSLLSSSCLVLSPSVRLVLSSFCLPSSLLSLSLSSFSSLSLSIFLCLLSLSPCDVVVVLLWCGVVCHVVLCCVECVRPKSPRVYLHHAHMLKHMCAWCRHTRGRFQRTHGGAWVRERAVVSLVFFIVKTSDF